MAFPIEDIPNEDFVYRNVHRMKFKDWETPRTPNEADFSLRENETYLSSNWNKYCTELDIFIMLGLQKTPKGNWRDFMEFKSIKLSVGKLRGMQLTEPNAVLVNHKPEDDNHSHSAIITEDDVEFRLKLCDLVFLDHK